MAMPAETTWQIAGNGLLASGCMELGQLPFIAARFSSSVDVVTNTSGAVIVMVFARLVSRRKAPEGAGRRRKAPEGAGRRRKAPEGAGAL